MHFFSSRKSHLCISMLTKVILKVLIVSSWGLSSENRFLVEFSSVSLCLFLSLCFCLALCFTCDFIWRSEVMCVFFYSSLSWFFFCCCYCCCSFCFVIRQVSHWTWRLLISYAAQPASPKDSPEPIWLVLGLQVPAVSPALWVYARHNRWIMADISPVFPAESLIVLFLSSAALLGINQGPLQARQVLYPSANPPRSQIDFFFII